MSTLLGLKRLREAASEAHQFVGNKKYRYRAPSEDSTVIESNNHNLLSDLKLLWYTLFFVFFFLVSLISFMYSDVEIVVDSRVFSLHRALLSARCKWLQVLLSERWKANQHSPITISSFSADVFQVIVDYIYTG